MRAKNMDYAAEGLKRAEAKLAQLQAQLAEMSARKEDLAYMLGWAEGGIKAALVEISVWKEA
jgi:hypothetical protein